MWWALTYFRYCYNLCNEGSSSIGSWQIMEVLRGFLDVRSSIIALAMLTVIPPSANGCFKRPNLHKHRSVCREDFLMQCKCITIPLKLCASYVRYQRQVTRHGAPRSEPLGLVVEAP